MGRAMRVLGGMAIVWACVAAGCGGEETGPSSSGSSTPSPVKSPVSKAPGIAALTEGVVVPGTYSSGAALAITFARQPSVAVWEPNDTSGTSVTSYKPTETTETSSPESTCVSDTMRIEKRPGPYSHPIKATDFEGSVFFVKSGAVSGNGSQESPFGTIRVALDAQIASGKTAAILVAGGNYPEDLKLSSGQYLFGGFDPATWERNLASSASTLRNQTQSLDISGGNADFATIVDGFTIYGAVQKGAEKTTFEAVTFEGKSKVIFRNNTVYMNMNVVDWETYGDTHHGTGIFSTEAAANVYHNRFLIDSATPEHTISAAMSFDKGCALILNNHIVGYRASLSTSGTVGSFINNLIEDGFNGISLFSGNMRVERNTIGLLEHDSGCGYAIYLGHYGDIDNTEPDTRPRLIRNVIILEGHGAQGITEPYAKGDPAALIENRFVLQNPDMKASGSYMLYGDYDQPHSPGKIVHAINDISQVNAMSDIPENSGNVVQ